MTSSDPQISEAIDVHQTSFPGLVVGASLLAMTATYILANSSLDVGLKAEGFLAIAGSLVIISVLVHLRAERCASGEARRRHIDTHLDIIDEAREYFSGSLDSSDTFRLMMGRIKPILPVSKAVLWTVSDAGNLTCKGSMGCEMPIDDAFAHSCRTAGAVLIDRSSGRRPDVRAAVPLFRRAEVFGVLEMFFNDRIQGGDTEELLEAISARVAPFILSSLAFDRSRDNALTDPTTNLPNERAFYLVLENQLSEADRKRAERPVTILAIDVKGFDGINSRFGHSTGDAVLRHVATMIRDSLRNMDLFARSANDEFLAILATASREISSEVITRIQGGLLRRTFKVDDTHSIELELNFGWAEFGTDGETAHELVEAARQRKSVAKHVGAGNVISFSQRL